MYPQAKRYTDKTVGRPEIQSCAEAQDLHKGRKGGLKTTSGFSREARVYVDLFEALAALIG
ncbi:restriction endonuclease [Aeromonas caviae]|uniref:restriction endonuclease n=1 Tax=Aeromonas caviae TaxID=648 RepID=UPI002B47E228|nr:restriction endonuclease [Aeromonas caviae]